MRLKNLKVQLLVIVAVFAGLNSSAVVGAEKTTYYYTNQQGTILATADAAGTIATNSDYRPFGMQALGNPMQGPGYTGHVNDADTGLVYMQARYYDAEVGRFLSTDPVSPTAGNSFNFGRYAYASNNPIVLSDPDGRDTVGQIIDQNAEAASNAGNGVALYGWAFAGVAWNALGAESVSKTSDDWSGSSRGDKIFAGVEIASALPPIKIMGEIATLAKDGAKATGILAKDGSRITGLTKHGVDRVVGDGAKRAGTKPTAILDALKNPRAVKEGTDAQGRAFKVYTGENARVVVNPETGKIISTNPLSRDGAH